MFTWVSRRRVTAPLGAALCDDLRRYYAQNNKVDSLTYMYRGVCRSDVPTHTRFTLSLREIAKLTSARLLSNESSRLDSQSVSRDLQQGLIRGYFYEKFHYGRVFASWWLISIERISFFKCREGCVIWLGKEGYSKEDGENYCCFFKEKKFLERRKFWLNCLRGETLEAIAWNLCHFSQKSSIVVFCHAAKIQTL